MVGESLRERVALYVVTDERPDHGDLLRVLRLALTGGATAVQLRNKHSDGGVVVAIGKKIRELTHEFGALYFVNDRVDIALLTNADGVHLGQTDISCADARKLLGDAAVIGVSASSLEEAQSAVRQGADYLGVGALFPTRTKLDADACSLKELKRIAENVDIPIVAIGGITAENAGRLTTAGAAGVAVVSAVMNADDPAAASRELLARIRG